MTPEEFRHYGHQIVDWIADYRARLAERPVMSPVEPGETRALVPADPPERGEPVENVLKDLDRVVLPGITHWNHPSFFAYFPSNAGLASVLADLVSSGLGAQAMSWQTSPAATELEEAMMDWLRQAVDLPKSFTGVIQDTASTATLVALLCARERATGFSQETKGYRAGLTVYASEEAHSSVAKAALLAGFGRDNLRLIPTDDEHALKPDALEKAIASDRAKGLTPCAVVATTGTTATTAFDPIEKIAKISDGLWLHVDAAMAGSAMILPECRPLWRGVERADSVVFNPHKWLGVAFDCTAYYVREPKTLVRVMSTNPSYLQTAADEKVRNLRDWGLQLGRRFRALKLWFVFREQGLENLRQRLRRDLENANWLAAQVDQTRDWERVAPVKLQTVCVRHKHADNLAIANRVNRSGRAYVTPSVLKGRQMIRVSIGAEATTRAEVAAVWSLLQSAA
ncbi:MAG: aspartate aminotransferase family protein [Myxococcales bacterium]